MPKRATSESVTVRAGRALAHEDPVIENPAQYWEQRLSKTDGLKGVGYYALGERFNRWMYAVRQEVFVRLLKEAHAVTEIQTVLDIGSGTGFYSGLWAKDSVKHVTATDLTEVAVTRLAARIATSGPPVLDVRRLDITAPLAPEMLHAFDAVSAMDMLFHIVDDTAWNNALKNLHDVLRPGGIAILSDNPGAEDRRKEAGHIVTRSRRQINESLCSAGFRIHRIVPMFVLMNYPAASSSRLAQWTWTAMVAPAALLGDVAGDLLGRILFPLERRLVARHHRRGSQSVSTHAWLLEAIPTPKLQERK